MALADDEASARGRGPLRAPRSSTSCVRLRAVRTAENDGAVATKHERAWLTPGGRRIAVRHPLAAPHDWVDGG